MEVPHIAGYMNLITAILRRVHGDSSFLDSNLNGVNDLLSSYFEDITTNLTLQRQDGMKASLEMLLEAPVRLLKGGDSLIVFAIVCTLGTICTMDIAPWETCHGPGEVPPGRDETTASALNIESSSLMRVPLFCSSARLFGRRPELGKGNEKIAAQGMQALENLSVESSEILRPHFATFIPHLVPYISNGGSNQTGSTQSLGGRVNGAHGQILSHRALLIIGRLGTRKAQFTSENGPHVDAFTLAETFILCCRQVLKR